MDNQWLSNEESKKRRDFNVDVLKNGDASLSDLTEIQKESFKSFWMRIPKKNLIWY